MELIEDHLQQRENMSPPVSLDGFLSVSVVLRNIVLHLPFSSIYRLAHTCKAIRANLLSSPDAFKYVDLSNILLVDSCSTIRNINDCGRSGHRSCDCNSNFNAHHGIDKISDGEKNDTCWQISRMKEPRSEEASCSLSAQSMLVHLGRTGILQHVQALILDNASVTAEFIMNDILIPTDEGRLSVRLLSIREARLTDESKLAAMLKDYALARGTASGVSHDFPWRQKKGDGFPRGIKGLYVFNKPMTARELSVAKCHMRGAESESWWISISLYGDEELDPSSTKCIGGDGNLWYERSGILIHNTIAPYWADTLKVCANETGILAFDAVICRGLRHDEDVMSKDERLKGLKHLPPEVAVAALGPDGCSNCGSAPEGFAYWHPQGTPGADLPLLSPLPKASITVREAKRPSSLQTPAGRGVSGGEERRRTIMRCRSCLASRRCSVCNRWWCEFCYKPVGTGIGFTAEFTAEMIVAHMDSATGARPLTVDAAFAIALEQYIRGEKFMLSSDFETYFCVERCLKEKVFRPMFDDA